VNGPPRSERDPWSIVVPWLGACIGLSFYCMCMQDRSLEELSLWILITCLLQLPAFPLAAHAATERPGELPRGTRIAGAIALSLLTGLSVMFFVAIAGERAWHDPDAWVDTDAIQIGMSLGSIAMIITLIRFNGRIRDQPHPRALRRGLLELSAVALAVVALVLHGEGVYFFGTGETLRGRLLSVIFPFLWMAPLWLLMPRRPRPAPPRATLR
jgi:uncharacterized membrane protein SpoIIM required for sporulation